MEFIQRHRIWLEAIVIVILAGLIGIMISFFGASAARYGTPIAPGETTVPVVINEVFLAFQESDPVPHQWLELYNRTNRDVSLEGWTIEMGASGILELPPIGMPPRTYAIVAASVDQFKVDYHPYTGKVISPSGGWPGLDQSNDFLVLRNAKGNPLDAVNWGQPPRKPDGVQLWEEPTFGGGAPWQVDYEYSYERNPVGLDRNKSDDFIVQVYPSPGNVNVPSSSRAANNLFISWTNVASYAGGILLWIAFVYIGLIARRFEALTQQRTYWQAMLGAPSGILIYNLVQAYGFIVRGNMKPNEQWWSFLILFVSALGCTALVFVFRQRAKQILEG
jgi:hypothetical protein